MTPAEELRGAADRRSAGLTRDAAITSFFAGVAITGGAMQLGSPLLAAADFGAVAAAWTWSLLRIERHLRTEVTA